MTAIAVTIAGSDSGGGAGIQADLKTFSALGVYGASVITALTAQNTLGVTAIHDVPPEFIGAQIDAVFSDLAVDAVKIGMLSQPEVIMAVANRLAAHGQTRIVIDPVMVATSGDPLLVPEAIEVLVSELLARAMVITPNMHEAARMLGEGLAEDDAAMQRQAEGLLRLGAKAVLLKGGHGSSAESRDLLLSAGGICEWFTAQRHVTDNTHGTGCTLSSAIAAGIAQGKSLRDAVAAAKDFVTQAIIAADALMIGSGHGPVHHFYSLWKDS